MNSLASIAPPRKPGVAVVEVADGDAGAGADIVVGLLLEQAHGAACRRGLAGCGPPSRGGCPRRWEAAGSSSSAAGARFRWRPARDHHQVGRLGLQAVVGVEVGDARWRWPRSSSTISRAIASVRSSQLPVARAMGITVFCVPFLAFTSQANPTHQRHRMHGPRPS